MENIIYERDYTQEVKEIRDKTYVRTSSVDVGRKLKGPNIMWHPAATLNCQYRLTMK